MKPYPLSSLNHLTVPVAMKISPPRGCARARRSCESNDLATACTPFAGLRARPERREPYHVVTPAPCPRRDRAAERQRGRAGAVRRPGGAGSETLAAQHPSRLRGEGEAPRPTQRDRPE